MGKSELCKFKTYTAPGKKGAHRKFPAGSLGVYYGGRWSLILGSEMHAWGFDALLIQYQRHDMDKSKAGLSQKNAGGWEAKVACWADAGSFCSPVPGVRHRGFSPPAAWWWLCLRHTPLIMVVVDDSELYG